MKEALRFLVEQGADVNVTCKKGSRYINISYVLRARGIRDFMNSAFVGGFMKSRISRVYGVHNMFSAEPENSGYGTCRFQAQGI